MPSSPWAPCGLSRHFQGLGVCRGGGGADREGAGELRGQLRPPHPGLSLISQGSPLDAQLQKELWAMSKFLSQGPVSPA